MRKGNNGTQVVTVLTNAGSEGSEYTLSLPDTGYEAGAKLTEVLSCTNVTVSDNGEVPVPMNSGLPRVFYPAAKLQGSGICQ